MVILTAYPNGDPQPKAYVAAGTPPALSRFVFVPETPTARLSLTLAESWQLPGCYVCHTANIDPASWSAFIGFIQEEYRSDPTSKPRLLWVSQQAESYAVKNRLLVVANKVQAAPFFINTITININRVAIDVTPDGEGFVFTRTRDNQLILAVEDSLNYVLFDAATLVVGGPDQGMFRFALNLSEQELAFFETGVAYFTPTQSAAPGPGMPPGSDREVEAKVYPLLELASAVPFDISLDPLASAFDADRNNLAFVPDPAEVALPSYFRSAQGHALGLLPQAKARLVLASRATQHDDTNALPSRRVYLVPAGDFAIQFPPAAGEAKSLLAGRAATEHFILEGDGEFRLRFTPGQPAFVRNVPWQEASALGAAAGPMLSDSATTAWVSVVPPMDGTVAFYGQPEGSPLYSPTATSANGKPAIAVSPAQERVLGNQLVRVRRYGTPTQRLGKATDEDQSTIPVVPLVPLAGVRASLQALDLETQRLVPVRLQVLTGGSRLLDAVTFAPDLTPITKAVTPQGFLVTVQNEQWQQVDLACYVPSPSQQPRRLGEEASARFGFSSLDGQLRQALLQSDVFLIMTGLSSGTSLNNELSIGDWHFKLNLPPVSSGPGTKQAGLPMLLIKFHTRSISDLLEDTYAYPDAYNTTPQLARKALLDVVAKAAAEVNTNPDDSPYRFLHNALNDAQWQGVLAFNVEVPTGDAPPEVQGILAALSPEFRAHHVGVKMNVISTNGRRELDIEQSSLFGLIDYQQQKSPAFSGFDPSDSYKFDVRLLRILFENSQIKKFECKIAFTVNQLFDEATTLTRPSAKELNANTIELDGLYQAPKAEGKKAGTYTFSNSQEQTFKLGAAGGQPILESVTITKLTFKTEVSTVSNRWESRFGLCGRLKFREFKDFDLLSFERLAFDDLGVVMTTTRPAGAESTTQTFEFAPGAIRFDVKSSLSRPGGLLSKLPLQLRFLLYAGPQPADLDVFSSLGFFRVPFPGSSPDVRPRFGLGFELDLGSMGALVSALKGLRCELLFAWSGAASMVGIKLPESNGGSRKEFGIEGIVKVIINHFAFCKSQDTYGLVLGDASVKIVNLQLPPKGGKFTALVFAPKTNPLQVSWAAVNKQPAGEPGSLSFKLLALGQRFRPKGLLNPRGTLGEAFKELESLADTETCSDLATVQSNADTSKAGWMLGARVGLPAFGDALQLEVLLLDPDLYGLRITGPDEFGLLKDIELLYRKLSDELGVFSLDIGMPPSLNTMMAGPVVVSLPRLRILVYSNGDFLIDLGFPDNFDFSRSFQVQVLPMIGYGGLYVAKLSGATSELLPGYRGTVLQAGFALRVGYGKELARGMFTCGASLTLYGILEGAIGLPPKDGLTSLNNLAVRGQVGIILALYGSVDFGITGLDFSAELRVGFGFQVTLLDGKLQPVQVWVEAEVRINVRWVIARFKVFGKRIEIAVRLRFNKLIRIEHTWGGNSQLIDSALLAYEKALAGPLEWDAAYSHFPPDAQPALPLYLLPEATPIASLLPSGGVSSGPSFVALFGLERTPTNDAGHSLSPGVEKPFDLLVQALLGWVVKTYLNLPDRAAVDSALLTLNEIRTLDEQLGAVRSLARSGAQSPLDYDCITEFLRNNFSVTVACDAAEPGLAVSVFPAPKEVELTFAGPGPVPGPVQFWTLPAYPEQYQDEVETYLQQFRPFETDKDTRRVAAPVGPAQTGAEIVFQDYVEAIIKGGVHEMRTLLQRGTSQALTLPQLFQAFREDERGDLFAMLGTMASRFFLNGLRLPQPGVAPGPPGRRRTVPLYVLTGQQLTMFPAGMPGAYPGTPYSVRLGLSSTATWLQPADSGSLTTSVEGEGFSELLRLMTPAPQPAILGLGLAPYLRHVPRTISLTGFSDWTDETTRRSDPAEAWLLTPDSDDGQPVPKQSTASAPSRRIFSFPQVLQQLMQELVSQLEPGLLKARLATKKVETASEDGQRSDGDVALDKYRWVTRVEVQVRRVVAPSGAEAAVAPSYVPCVYEVVGAAEAIRLLLAQLGHESVSGGLEPVSLLHLVPRVGAKTDSQQVVTLTTDTLDSTVLLYKTNLSQDSNPGSDNRLLPAPPETVGATLSQPQEFLRLLYECSIVNNGGFYLYYRTAAGVGLPDALFMEGGPAATTPMVVVVPHRQRSDEQLLPIANAVVGFSDELLEAPEQFVKTIVYVRCQKQDVFEPILQPGLAALRLYRPNPDNHYQIPVGKGLAQAGSMLSRSQLVAILATQGITEFQQPEEFNQLLRQAQPAGQEHALSFNLLDVGIDQAGPFAQLLPEAGLPIGPSEVDTDALLPDEKLPESGITTGDWRYDHPLPLPKLLRAAPANPDVVPVYEAVGQSLKGSIGFRDVFGNRHPDWVYPFTLPIRYFDRLLPVSDWAGTVLSWEPTAKDTITLKLEWTATPTHAFALAGAAPALQLAAATDAANASLDVYKLVLAQLYDANTSYTLQTSLGTDRPLADSERMKLKTFVRSVISKLRQPDGPAVGPVNMVVKLPPATRPGSYQPLRVGLRITRPRDLVDIQVAQHYTQAFEASAEAHTSRTPSFLADFTRHFTDLRLAYGAGKGDNRPLWTIPASWLTGGIIPRPDQVIYFAPRPLSNELVTLEARQYKVFDAAFGSPQPRLLGFEAGDVDVLMRDFLRFVEEFLAPDRVAQMPRSADGQLSDSTAAIIRGKGALAEAFSQLAVPVLAKDYATGWSAYSAGARRALAERLRRDLRDAYAIEAIVQLPITLAVPVIAGPLAPFLYGSVTGKSVGETDTTKNTVLPSQAKVELRPTAGPATDEPALTFLVDAVPDQAHLQASFSYRVTHIELQPPAILGDVYQATRWLQLAQPVDLPLTGAQPLDVPLPRREYPAAPVLRKHQAIAASSRSRRQADNEAAARLREARSWGYTVDFSRPRIANDKVYAEVEYTAPQPSEQLRLVDEELPLPALTAALYQFTLSREALASVLWPVGTISPQLGSRPAAQSAVEFLENCVVQIVNQLVRLTQPQAQLLAAPIVPDVEKMYFRDVPELPTPKVVFLGPHTTTGARLERLNGEGTPIASRDAASSSANADNWLYRRLTLPGQDILSRASAWGQLYITRNEQLQADEAIQTAAPFIYRSSTARFIDQLTPLLSYSKQIDLAELANLTGQSPLKDYLQALYKVLLSDDGTGRELEISIQCRFAFPVVTPFADESVALDLLTKAPVLLLRPTKCTLQSITDLHLETVVEDWQRAHPPVSTGGYLFDCTIFATQPTNLAVTKRPVLRLERLWLALARLSPVDAPALKSSKSASN